jgi:hypothetical protein
MQIKAAIRRELNGRRLEVATHRHRVPLGLMMLELGWITSHQLREVLEVQKSAGHGRIGYWMVQHCGISEMLVTRALGLQWSCPVLSVDSHGPDKIAPALPRLFIEAFGALPLRIAGGEILYLGFEDRLDPVLALATERMLGLRVETGLVRESLFGAAHENMLHAKFPSSQLIEATSEATLTRLLTKAVEGAKPFQSRLVRVHDCLWLRMWTRPQSGPLPEAGGVEDVLCSLSSNHG